jgi:hypothetical protein
MVYGPFLGAVLTSAAFHLALGDPQHEPNRTENPIGALAGEYFFHSGFEGESLEISPKRRFKLDYHNCTGRYRVSGNAKFVDGHLALRTDLVYRMFVGNPPPNLISIRWGDRLY